jgi:hypothetical protein
LRFQYHFNYFNAFIKYQSISFADFLASIGGIVGLIAGVSVISFVELLYYLIVYCLSFRQSKRIFRRVHPEIFEESSGRNILNQNHAIFQCSQYFFKFIKESSIHGLIYTTKKSEHIYGRIFWIVFMLVSTFACSYLIRDTMIHAELNPIAFSIDEELWKIDKV